MIFKHRMCQTFVSVFKMAMMVDDTNLLSDYFKTFLQKIDMSDTFKMIDRISSQKIYVIGLFSC